MSVTLASISLASVSVGTTGLYDFSQVLASQALPLATQMNPIANAGMLMMFNESNVGLQLTFLDSQHQINFPAGAWRRIPITASDRSFTWKVVYQIANPLTTTMLIDYYRPGELIDEVGSLGNSPIGGSISTTTTYQLYDPGNVDFFDAHVGAFGGGQALRLQAHSQFGSPAGMGIALSYQVPAPPSGIFQDVLAFDPINAVMTLGFPFANIAGVNVAAGAFGVPVVPGLARRQHITATTLTTVLTYTPASTGVFRATPYVYINNGTGGNAVLFRTNYFDPDKGSSTAENISALNPLGAGASIHVFDGISSAGNGSYTCEPQSFPLAAGQPFTVTYQDPTNTPSDFVTVFLEQVA